jgi:3'-phosphoadenosine 5'-phosphosulfate sulfotransferase (PAPS reductase)/FAD synthetase
MMTENLDEVRELAASLGGDFALVVNHSGGKDSMRMLGFIRNHFPDCKTHIPPDGGTASVILNIYVGHSDTRFTGILLMY